MRPPQVPGLAVVIVGDRKDSATYVRMKKKACADVGIRSFDCDLPGDASQADVLAAVSRFNSDPDVHGILVQLPVRSRRTTAPRPRSARALQRQRGPAAACRRARAGKRTCSMALARGCAGAAPRSVPSAELSPRADRSLPRAAAARSCRSTSTRRRCCRPYRWKRTWMGSTRSTSGALR